MDRQWLLFSFLGKKLLVSILVIPELSLLDHSLILDRHSIVKKKKEFPNVFQWNIKNYDGMLFL